MNDDIPYWTWINDTTLGIVTDREVYHWKVMEGQTSPTKVRTAPFLVSFTIYATRGLTVTLRCSTDMRTSSTTKSSVTKCHQMVNGLSLSVSRQTQTHQGSRSRVHYSSTPWSGASRNLSKDTRLRFRHSRWIQHPSPPSSLRSPSGPLQELWQVIKPQTISLADSHESRADFSLASRRRNRSQGPKSTIPEKGSRGLLPS